MDSDLLSYPNDPEIVVGIVAPIGTPLDYFKRHLSRSLKSKNIDTLVIKLSEFAAKAMNQEAPASESRYQRYSRLMSAGNQLRRRSGYDDILPLFAAAQLQASRPTADPRHIAATAIIVDQLKRPEEVFRLRRIYSDNFLLIGLYCPKDVRKKHLEHAGVDPEEAEELISRDEDDAAKHGQRVADTYHLADFFLEVTGNVGDNAESARLQRALERFWSLVFGSKIETPSRGEYGMYLAHAASLRSSSLARQVGAVIVSEHSEVISVGANDIPCFPGGLYWGDETNLSGKPRDARDHTLGFDESDRMKLEILKEILPVFFPEWTDKSESERSKALGESLARLKGTRVTSLTEFARAVHAEMEAISSAARLGVSVRGATLYTTTFPCHNCAKHIVASGIKRVVYIEPYPKSRALQMYGDSIFAVGESDASQRDMKVTFEPFVGVSPRRFADLFGRHSHEGRQWEYKNKDTGDLVDEQVRLRIPFSPFSYVIREGLAAKELKALEVRINVPTEGGSDAPAE